jgi:hypothetical protein
VAKQIWNSNEIYSSAKSESTPNNSVSSRGYPLKFKNMQSWFPLRKSMRMHGKNLQNSVLHGFRTINSTIDTSNLKPTQNSLFLALKAFFPQTGSVSHNQGSMSFVKFFI